MITVKYISGVNKKAFTLNKGYDVAIKECNPHASKWTYESAEQQLGVKVTSFTKDPIVLNITLKFRGTLDGIHENLDAFFEECETDVIEKKQGQLYVGSEYLSGWIVSRETAPASDFYGYEQTISFLAPYPFYILEKSNSFFPAGSGAGETNGLDYDYDYEYDYAGDPDGNRTWYIDHFTSSEFEMTIFGPCENPRININGYPYQVYDTLEEGEYLTINSRNNTVTKYLANGTTQNIYDLRAKEQSIFEKIPGGDLNVVWNAAFGFDITLYLERSEPRWN